VHVEAAPGIVIVVPAWMLDRAACAGMSIGAPRIAVAALVELHHLLIERGFRRSSSGNVVVREMQDETRDKPITIDAATSAAPAYPGARLGSPARDELARASPRARLSGEPPEPGRRHPGRGARS
jgi:hypothetical protein